MATFDVQEEEEEEKEKEVGDFFEGVCVCV